MREFLKEFSKSSQKFFLYLKNGVKKQSKIEKKKKIFFNKFLRF